MAEAKLHVMAMPLDYIVDWVSTRGCNNEACLRFPAAIWGTLTLWVGYRLFRRLGGERVAIVGMLFLALSPFLIRYSQEARFYASMLFFYVFASELLLAAIQKPSSGRWILFTIVTIVGTYFHIFVLFAFVNGFFWLIFLKKIRRDYKIWLYYLGSGLVVLVFFIPGYLFFSNHIKLDYQPMSLIVTVISLITAWGWFPQAPGSGLAWIWYGLIALFSILGMYWAIRRKMLLVMAILLSLILQIAAVILFDNLWSYFVVDRQFLVTLPFICLFAALGFSFIGGHGLITQTSESDPILQSKLIRRIPIFLSIIFVGLLIFSYIPAISDYYRLERSHGREISEILSSAWVSGDVIYVFPTFGTIVFQYYLDRIGRTDIASLLRGTEISGIPVKSLMDKSDFLITPATSGQATKWIEQLGFQRQYPSGNDYSPDAEFLWARKSPTQ